MILPYRHPQAPPGSVGGWAGREGGPAHPKLCGAGGQLAGVRKAGRRWQCPYSPPKWHRIFTKSMRAVGGSVLEPGRQVERVPAEREPGPPVGSRRERPCVSSLAPGRQARSRLHSVRRDSSWHQLQSGTMPGFLSFFLPFYKKNLIEGREGPEPLTEQLSIVEASGTMCP